MNQILEDCLTAIRSGKATLEECAARYPHLKQELQVALVLERLPVAYLPADQVRRLEAKLTSRLEQQGHKTIPWRPQPRPTLLQYAGKWAAAAVFVLVFMLGAGGGTVAASANSVPGDTLYGVKRAWEQVILVMATLIGRADDMLLHLAQVRFEELESLSAAGSVTGSQLDELSRILEQTILTADIITTPEVVKFMENAQTRWSAVKPQATAQRQYERAAALLQPHLDNNGRLQLVSLVETTPPQVIPTLTFTPQPSLTFTPTFTATNTAQPTLTYTASYTPTITRTPTPTRTPVAVVEASPTLTNTPLPSPTATYTPLPLPVGNVQNPTPIASVVVGAGAPPTLTTVGDGQPLVVRQTQAAVYATQTAIASGAVPTEEAVPPSP